MSEGEDHQGEEHQGEDHLRAGDADRDRAVAELHGHHAAGRLEDGEFEQRVAAAYAAVTWGQLTELFDDLPSAAAARAPSATAYAPAVTQQAVLPAHVLRGAVDSGDSVSMVVPGPPAAVADALIVQVGPLVAADRYRLTARSAHRITYTRSRIPRWAIVAAVLLPLPGVLFLLIRQHVDLHLDLLPAGADGTHVTVSRVRR